jgi:hypothetical protein
VVTDAWLSRRNGNKRNLKEYNESLVRRVWSSLTIEFQAPSGKSLCILDGKRQLIIMDLEEIAEKYSMKDLRPLAKKYGISLRCAKKMDVLKALPPEGLAELESK